MEPITTHVASEGPPKLKDSTDLSGANHASCCKWRAPKSEILQIKCSKSCFVLQVKGPQNWKFVTTSSPRDQVGYQQSIRRSATLKEERWLQWEVCTGHWQALFYLWCMTGVRGKSWLYQYHRFHYRFFEGVREYRMCSFCRLLASVVRLRVYSLGYRHRELIVREQLSVISVESFQLRSSLLPHLHSVLGRDFG